MDEELGVTDWKPHSQWTDICNTNDKQYTVPKRNVINKWLLHSRIKGCPATW